MSGGKMTLHRLKGDEIYSVLSATIKEGQAENGCFAMTFNAKAAWPPIKMLSDTESLPTQPAVEITIRSAEPAAVFLNPAATFTPPGGLAENMREPQASFHYRE